MILEIAGEMHWKACEQYRWGTRDLRLAAPFGTPPDMPPHEWRVSFDILQALHNASPLPVGPNPKTSEGATRLLFGWPVVPDAALRDGTMRLELVK